MPQKLFLVILSLMCNGICWGETSSMKKVVGVWHFDEGMGKEAKDTSGNEHHGLLGSEGEEPVWEEGRFGTGLKFKKDKKNRVEIPDSEALNPKQQITLVAWIKPSKELKGKNTEIICKQWDSSKAGYRLRFCWDKVSFSIGDIAVSSQTLELGFWYHIAATFDGKTMKLFINTKLDKFKELDNEVEIVHQAGPMVIGGYIGPKNYSVFDGIIDEIAIFDVALTEEEIVLLLQNKWGDFVKKENSVVTEAGITQGGRLNVYSTEMDADYFADGVDLLGGDGNCDGSECN